MEVMALHRPRPVGERPLVHEDRPIPGPGPGEIRLRVHACGVCHTDLHTVEGELDLPRLPVVPGHQIVGTVDAVGEGVTRFSLGDRVGVPWLHGSCGECEYCTAGEENLCEHAQFTGLHVDGGYAQFAVARADFTYPIPEGFPDMQAAPLLCAGIIGYRALRLSEIRPGGRLGLWGFGASAHITIQVAKHWRCRVAVLTRDADHRAHARQLGADWVGGPGERPPDPLDAIVNFTPAGETVPDCLRALRKGGTCALGGIHMSPLPQMEYALLYGERTLRSVANFTRRDAEELLALAVEIPIRTDVEVVPLAEANEILLRLKRDGIHGAAVLEIP